MLKNKYNPVITNGYYQTKSGYNYSYLFYSELKCFDDVYGDYKRKWLGDTWQRSLLYSAIYLLLIHIGQKMMEKRERFNLRLPLIAWNVSLAVFSTIGAIRIWPEFIYTLSHHGLEYSVCNNSNSYGVYGCWTLLFVVSKVAELLDTAFVILRKQRLMFLHWYHHATVLVYTWYSTKDLSASGRWFVVMNYTIHAFMYTYYAFRALRFRIPKAVSIAITVGQISQMIFGIYINITAYNVRKRGESCDVTFENIMVSFAMYASYFLLFCHFFHLAYVKRTTTKKLANGKLNGATSSNHAHSD